MRSKDVYVRLEAAQGLSWLVLNARESVKGLPPRRLQELVSALETALSDADHRVRHQATAGLVELGGVQSHRPLRLAAEDAHADVRLVAVTALSYLDDPESRATLRKAAADTEHEIRWIDHARPGCFVCLR
jgi:HEAT repeat protein